MLLHDTASRTQIDDHGLAHERRLMMRTIRMVLLVGACFALVGLTFPNDEQTNDLGVAAACVSSLALAGLGFALPPRLTSDWLMVAMLSIAGVNISVEIFFTGDHASGLELFYLWGVPTVYAFFSARAAALMTAWAGICLGGVFVAEWAVGRGDHHEHHTSVFFLVMGTIIVVGILVRRVAAWMRDREARFRRGFEDSPLGMSVTGADLRYLEVNDAMCRITGRSREELLACTVDDVAHPDDIAPAHAVVSDGLATGGASAFARRYLRPDGSVVDAAVTASVIRGEGGRPIYFFNQIEDVTARRRDERQLADRARQQAAVAVLGQVALRTTDLVGLMQETVETVTATLAVELCAVLELQPDGVALEPMAGIGWDPALTPEAPVTASLRSYARFTLESAAPVVVEDLAVDTRFTASPMLARHGVASGLSVVIEGWDGSFGVLGAYATSRRSFNANDLNFMQSVAHVLASAVERHRRDEAIRHAALHDPLTDLPNRKLALERLSAALRRRREDGQTVAVMLLDLDGFKAVNDTLGHAAGDELLVTLASRLRDAVRPEDTVARLGGDEFIVICHELDGTAGAVVVAERLCRAVSRPVLLDSQERQVSASVGIALAAGPDDGPQALLRQSDAAMYSVKRCGRGGYALFGREAPSDSCLV
jgi:diguanylate cyclase (GGDEF)-like protein/PAS domain S-box-containing protein